MGLVIVGPGYPPTTGGIETHISQLATRFAQWGVAVEVWAPDAAMAVPTTTVQDGVLVRRFPSTSSARFPFSRSLFAYARRHLSQVRLIHTHSYHNFVASVALLAPAQTPVVFTPHFHGVGHTAMAKAAHVVYRPAIGVRLFRRANRVIAVSFAESKLIGSEFASVAQRITVIRNGTRSDLIKAAEPWPGEPATVLVIGRLEEYKRVDETIRSFARSTFAGQLVIIGDGPARQHLEEVARAGSRAQSIHFLGRVDDDSLYRWLCTAHAVVSMSEHEAFGLIALEAAAGGARALVSDIPAHREVRDMVPDGMVTIVGSPDALVAGLNDLHLLSTVPGVDVRTWEQAAREHIELFTTLVDRDELAL